MTVLNDIRLRKRIDSPRFKKGRRLEIDPIDMDEQIQPSSIDLRLSNETVNLDTDSAETHEGEVSFLPDVTYLASTKETVTIPEDCAAMVKGRSSVGRQGLQIHTAGWVDPGFSGEITLEVTNLTNHLKEMEVGERICQIVLLKMVGSPENHYGEKSDQKYQGQTGPTRSRMD